jgi:lipopolysaccharide export LptBFGC system permease protein LptF
MDEIRFNPIDQPKPQKDFGEVKKDLKTISKFSFKKVAFIFVIILVLLAVSAALFKMYGGKTVSYGQTAGKANNAADASASNYYAVFLSDGQIYFGQITENNSSEMVISDAYHLQSNGQTYQSLNQNQNVPAGASFSLIRVSDELHGPTNKIFINHNQILFYEQLRKDSKVVQLIQEKGR